MKPYSNTILWLWCSFSNSYGIGKSPKLCYGTCTLHTIYIRFSLPHVMGQLTFQIVAVQCLVLFLMLLLLLRFIHVFSSPCMILWLRTFNVSEICLCCHPHPCIVTWSNQIIWLHIMIAILCYIMLIYTLLNW